MALVKINPGDDPFDRLIDRRVFENNICRLAAEFERQFRFCPCRAHATSCAMRFANFRRAGERNFVDVRMIHERRAGFARAGDDVHHAFRQFRFLKNLRQPHRGDAGGLRRLQHHGVPARQRRRDFPRRHQQRKIPRNDLPGDAQRLRVSAGKSVFQFVRPAGVIKKMRRHQRQIHVAAFLDRSCRRPSFRARPIRAPFPG